MALDRYLSLDLHENELDEDWLALRGRLEKDLALAGEPDKAQFARAAQAYREAYRRSGGSYSAINAASKLMSAGRPGPGTTMEHECLSRTIRVGHGLGKG